MTRKTTFLKSLSFLLALFFSFQRQDISAQANFGSRIADTVNLVTDFGADSTGTLDASYALIKASRYIENKWNIHGDKLVSTDPDNINYSTHYVRLEIPAGVYKVGTEVSLMSAPYDTFYHKYTSSQPSKSLKYTVLYKDTFPDGTFRNNNEAIDITFYNLANCYSMPVYAPKNYYPVELFNITNDTSNIGNLINGVEIVGIGNTKPVFKYADGNHVGWMDTLGNPIVPYYTTPPVVVCNYYWQLYHSSADLFYISYCNNIKISNLEINGNIPHTYYMGPGSEGYQGGAHGLRLNAKHVSLNDLYIHHMQMDGIYLQDRNPDSTTNFVADNIKCEYNRRQGMTWSVGDSVIVKNSEFNYSGRAASLIQSITDMASAPAAGIDFEYGGEGDDTLRKYMIRNGYFINCKFIDNVGSALINDYDAESQVRVINMNFLKDTMFNAETYGIHCDGRQFSYDSCGIYGTVIDAGWADSLNGETKFRHCTFEDKPFNGKHWIGYRLVEITDRTKTLFQNCTFKVNDSARGVFHINWNTTHPNKADWTVFDNCSILYNNMGQTDNNNKSFLKWVLFRNKNIVKNVLNGLNSFQIFETAHAEIEGSTDPCNPSSIEFEGQVMHQLAYDAGADTLEIGKTAGGGDGYAQYILKDKSIAWPKAGRRINIGENSSMHIMGGASIYAGGEYYIDGQVIAHAKSYVALPDASFYGSGGLMYIDAACNPNHATTSPLWCNGTGFGTAYPSPLDIYTPNWLNTATIGTSGVPCVQGGHTALTSWACTPAYHNVLSKKSISVLYNKSVGCFGASNSAIDFTITGGTAPYSYSWDYAATVTGIGSGTNIHLSTNAIGNHTLIITDATPCIDTFIVNLDTAFKYQILKGCVNGTPAQFSTNACDTLIVTGPSGANTTHSGNVYTVHATGTYTVVATSSTGSMTTTIFIGQCDSCSVADITAQWFAPDSPVTAMFPDGIAPSGPIVLSGKMSVDTTLYIYNNANVFLTSGSEFDIDTNQTIVVNASTLKGCNSYWKGITADGLNRTVIVNNKSTVKDMSSGIQIRNNAFLQARNSTFLNNLNQGIAFYGMNDPNYNGVVWANMFKSDTSMFSFGGTDLCQARNGIYIYNSSYVDVGSLNGVAYGDTFQNLNCGIRLYGDMNIATKLDTNRSKIGLYNNNFYMLKDCAVSGSAPEHQKLDHCYSHPYGVGIYAAYGSAPALFDAQVEVLNTDAANSSTAFLECDKGIVCSNVSLEARNLYIQNALMGIMCRQTTGRKYKVNDNTLESSFLGMQFIGDNETSEVKNNIINCGDVSVTYGDDFYSWPIGIGVRNVSNINTDTFTIEQNTITIPQYAGIGVQLENSGSGMHVHTNNISFSSTDTATLVSNTSSLMNGIYATNCMGSGLQQNHVNATNDLMIASREDEAGIFANNSTGLAITCNLIQTMRFGMMAQSNCYTDSDKVKGNTMFNHVLGWAFRHLGNEGTFGNVGDSTHDNNNIFAGSNFVKKVFKFCDTLQSYIIYTNALAFNESGSYNLTSGISNDCKYDVEPNSGLIITTYECPVIYPSYYSTSSIDLEEALEIANDKKTYSEYPELSHWMDAKKLYQILERNETLRYSDSILSTFYTDMQDEMIGLENTADTRLLALITSMSSLDPDLYNQRMEEAIETNSNIPDIDVQDVNEGLINDIYLKILRCGTDSLNNEDSTNIVVIANQCPYIGGTAVYKARPLYAMYEPSSVFDDLKLCNEIGVYRAGNSSDKTKGLFDAENDYLKSLKQVPEKAIVSLNQLLIYPNPTTSEIHIKYRKENDSKLQIVNMLGVVMKEIFLSKDVRHVLSSVGDLTSGIYLYRQIENGVIVSTGKLIIVN